MEAERSTVETWLGDGTYRQWQTQISAVLRAAERIGAPEARIAGRLISVSTPQAGYFVTSLPMYGEGPAQPLSLRVADLAAAFAPDAAPADPDALTLYNLLYEPQHERMHLIFRSRVRTLTAVASAAMPCRALSGQPDAVCAGSFDLSRLVAAVPPSGAVQFHLALLPPESDGGVALAAAVTAAGETSGSPGVTVFSEVLGKVPADRDLAPCGISLWTVPGALLGSLPVPAQTQVVLTGWGVALRSAAVVLELPRLG